MQRNKAFNVRRSLSEEYIIFYGDYDLTVKIDFFQISIWYKYSPGWSVKAKENPKL